MDTIRVPLQWQLVEPRPGQLDWHTTDQIVNVVQAERVELLFTLRSISPWSTKEQTRASGIFHSSSPPKDIKQWQRFVEALATRYRGRDVHYEIENEVNGRAFWTGTPAEYQDLLKASYSAIKRADPQAKVLSSAMGCGIVRNFQPLARRGEAWRWHDDWLRSILGTKAFDVVSVHNYYFPSEIAANGLTFRTYLQHIHELVRAAGVEDRPIWITETGYVSRATNASGRMDDGSPEKQARWLTEAYQQAFELGVERVFWLLLRDRNEPYFGSMGLADAQGKPRPAWNAIRQLIKAKERM